MRLLPLLILSLVALGGCSSSGDNVATDDSNELNEGRGSLERKIDPPMAAPSSDKIGTSISEILTAAKGTLTGKVIATTDEDCKQTNYKDTAKKQLVQHIECSKSVTVRIANEEGATISENADLNKDGKVDKWSGEDGSLIQIADTDFDGKIDLVIESVAKVKDFSMDGYDETFPKAKFLHRVREDRDRDGKFDHEKLTAKGILPPASSPSAE